MTTRLVRPINVLAAAACALSAMPVFAQQVREAAQPPVRVAAPAAEAQPGAVAERSGIIVVGGKPGQETASGRKPESVLLNPQPLPPHPPAPDPRPATEAVGPPAAAGRAGIIVVGGKPAQPGVDQAPAPIPAGNRQLQKTRARQGP